MRKRKPSIYYKTEMVKIKDDILWRCVEMPSKLVLKESFFEEDVKQLTKFQVKFKPSRLILDHINKNNDI